MAIHAGCCRNVSIEINEQPIKYGVVSVDVLRDELKHWRSLYLSGRLQKPVDVIVDDIDFAAANSSNLKGAVDTSCLLLPSRSSTRDLFVAIASLSYTGWPPFAVIDPSRRRPS